MNRSIRLSTLVQSVALCAATLSIGVGCGKTPMDMEDLAGGEADMTMAGGGDMAMGGGDMAMGGGDMAMGGTMLTEVPKCEKREVTAQQLYMGVVTRACIREGSCHGTNLMMGAIPAITTIDAFRKWAMSPAAQTKEVPLVKAGDIQQSYLMYKLLNQQSKVKGSGTGMPRPGMGMMFMQLPDAQLCQFINWIEAGAK